jgi:hypothetical protein
MRGNLLSILDEIHFDIATGKGSDKFSFGKAIEQSVTFALEFLLEDDRFAIDLNAQRLRAIVR